MVCEQTRTFKSKSVAKKWMNLHAKRCACCEGTGLFESEVHYHVPDDKQSNLESERAKCATHLKSLQHELLHT